MSVERTGGGTSVVDVLDRVLDKGIVIEGRARVSPVGIDLTSIETRVIVASLDTCIKDPAAMAGVTPASRPAELLRA